MTIDVLLLEKIRKGKVGTIDLSGKEISGLDLCGLFIAIKEGGNITTLDLSNNILGDLWVDIIAMSLRLDDKIVTLSLRNIGITTEGAKKIANVLEHNTTLIELDLSENVIDIAVLVTIQGSLQRNRDLQVMCAIIRLNKITELDLGKRHFCLGELRAILEALQQNTSITEIDFTFTKICRQGLEYIGGFLKTNATLKCLSLNLNDLGNEGVQLIMEGLYGNKTLFELNLKCNNISSGATKAISAFLVQNQALKSLNLSNNDIDDTGAQYLLYSLRFNYTLTSLVLHKNPVSELKDFLIGRKLLLNYAFCELINHCKGDDVVSINLSSLAEHLELEEGSSLLFLGTQVANVFQLRPDIKRRLIFKSTNHISERNILLIANVLKNCSTITSIELSGKISAAGMRCLTSALLQHKSLEYITIVGEIGDEGARFIADMLLQNNVLIHLHLINSKIGLQGMQRIASALTISNKTLILLDISLNAICKEGAASLARVLRCNKVLRTLVLVQCSIDLAGIVLIADSLKANCALEDLILLGNNLDKRCVDRFLQVLKHNCVLKNLSLYEPMLGGDCVISSKKAETINNYLIRNRKIGDMINVVMVASMKLNGSSGFREGADESDEFLRAIVSADLHKILELTSVSSDTAFHFGDNHCLEIAVVYAHLLMTGKIQINYTQQEAVGRLLNIIAIIAKNTMEILDVIQQARGLEEKYKDLLLRFALKNIPIFNSVFSEVLNEIIDQTCKVHKMLSCTLKIFNKHIEIITRTKELAMLLGFDRGMLKQAGLVDISPIEEGQSVLLAAHGYNASPRGELVCDGTLISLCGQNPASFGREPSSSSMYPYP